MDEEGHAGDHKGPHPALPFPRPYAFEGLQEYFLVFCLTLAVECYVNDDDCNREAEEHEDENGGEVSFYGGG